jgi:hypothetical protein
MKLRKYTCELCVTSSAVERSLLDSKFSKKHPLKKQIKNGLLTTLIIAPFRGLGKKSLSPRAQS